MEDIQTMSQRRESKTDYVNPAKSYSRYNKTGAPHNDSGKKGTNGKKNKNGKNGGNHVSKRVGYVLATLQALATIAFMAMLFVLDMLPIKFIGVIGAVLFILLLLVFVTQWKSKQKAIAGKVFSVFMTIVLATGSYYLGVANGAVSKISGGGQKIDKVVVAVLADDAAEKIEDAKDYNFGVQYNMGGKDVRATVDAINEEVGGQIQTTEYQSIPEQAQALHDGKVDAIVYNEGYAGVLEEGFEGYSENVKIIYSHSIKTKIENTVKKFEVTEDTFSVFISGIDVFGAISTNSRSDVNIIATVNPKTHQVLLTTTPRDYYVEIPEVSGGSKDKLTHAGIYGVDASMATLEKLYDTEIDFYARVNFTSLIEIINTLGGVEVNSEYEFTTSYDSGMRFHVEKGLNKFNGKQALAFSRERQNIPGGDNQRGKNQQAVITAIIKKMISPTMLVKANGIINSVSGNVETNMSKDQIQELIKMQMSKGGAWNIYSVAAEGTGDKQACFSSGSMQLYVTQPDQSSVDNIKSLIDRVEQGEVLEGSETAQ